MKNKKLLVIPASLFITGCQHALLTTAVCPTQTVTVTPNCHDAATPRRELTINVNMPQLQAVPPIVCANVGKPIEVKIRPMNSGVAVITVPKNPSDDWIYAGNTPDQNSMTINVPADTETERDYHYLIIASNGKCLDPEFHVDD